MGLNPVCVDLSTILNHVMLFKCMWVKCYVEQKNPSAKNKIYTLQIVWHQPKNIDPKSIPKAENYKKYFFP